MKGKVIFEFVPKQECLLVWPHMYDLCSLKCENCLKVTV